MASKDAQGLMKKEDWDIFAASKTNPVLFTNYYIRHLYGTGTRYRWIPEDFHVDAPTELFQAKVDARIFQIRNNYSTLHWVWEELGRAEYFAKDGHANWKTLSRQEWEIINDSLLQPTYMAKPDENYGKDHPVFFRHHGFIPIPWQLQVATAVQTQIVILGGYGSGKSSWSLVEMLIEAATLKNFRGFVIAPYMKQAKEVYLKAREFLFGSIFAQRFIPKDGWQRRDPMGIRIENEACGESMIEFIAALDDPDKIKNLQGDKAIIEQCEQFPDLLSEDEGICAFTTSRLRGYDFASGRERVGKCHYIANSNSNPELWGLVARAETDPDVYASFIVNTLDNPTVSMVQINTWFKTFARNPKQAEVSLGGGRPSGSGTEFSGEAVDMCRDMDLNHFMAAGLKRGTPGFVRQSIPGVDIFRWEIPYEREGSYATFVDPGWGNPPQRNAPVIMTIRHDGFPQKPAELVAFHWVFAEGRPRQWINELSANVKKYHVMPGSILYDSTGPQQGYEEMDKRLNAMGATGVIFQPVLRDGWITFLRMILESGLWIWAEEILGIGNQLTNFVRPEPKTLAQDIVMTMALGAAFLQPLYVTWADELVRAEMERYAPPPQHRHERPNDVPIERHTRSVKR